MQDRYEADQDDEIELLTSIEVQELRPSSQELVQLAWVLRHKIDDNHRAFLETQIQEFRDAYDLGIRVLNDPVLSEIMSRPGSMAFTDRERLPPFKKLVGFVFERLGYDRVVEVSRAFGRQYKYETKPRSDELWKGLAKW